jgi:hypothetical protein
VIAAAWAAAIGAAPEEIAWEIGALGIRVAKGAHSAEVNRVPERKPPAIADFPVRARAAGEAVLARAAAVLVAVAAGGGVREEGVQRS